MKKTNKSHVLLGSAILLILIILFFLVFIKASPQSNSSENISKISLQSNPSEKVSKISPQSNSSENISKVSQNSNSSEDISKTLQQLQYLEGVWDNCKFDKPAEYWSKEAKEFGGERGVVDLVIAQAQDQNFSYVPFPSENSGYVTSDNENDKVEPYLEKFDKDGVKVILSIQPNGADVSDLIDRILKRYGNHKCVIGVNVDLEWKLTGNPYHASNEERDIWLKKIQSYNPGFKLFLTYYKDHTYFPDDKKDIVILYDGEGDTQNQLMSEYKELASHYTSVGIYTGYTSCTPSTASHDSIMDTAPNTKYILHVIDD